MLTGTVELSVDGKPQQVEIQIKNFAHEITIGEWDEMLQYQEEQVPEFIKEPDCDFDNLTPEQDLEVAMYMIGLVSIFCNEGYEGVLQIPKGGTLKEPAGATVTLAAAFEAIVETVNGYVPVPQNTFTHHGEKFILPSESITELGQKEYGPNMKVIEMVEALQAVTAFSQIKDGVHTFKDYRKKSVQFITASLARKVLENGEVETVGKDLKEHHARVEKRGKFFQDMPLSTALNIRFFLTRLATT